jgi:hypothetical protein
VLKVKAGGRPSFARDRAPNLELFLEESAQFLGRRALVVERGAVQALSHVLGALLSPIWF